VEGEQRPHTPPPFRDGPGSNANLPGPFPPISQLHRRLCSVHAPQTDRTSARRRTRLC
jgi:hypothetical protein